MPPTILPPPPQVGLLPEELVEVRRIAQVIRVQTQALAVLLSEMPGTWQFVADTARFGVGPKIPFPVVLKPFANRWAPVYREGWNAKRVRRSLASLCAAKNRMEASRLLCNAYSGEALVRLRVLVSSFHSFVSNRQPASWWRHLPVPTPNSAAVARFLSKVGSDQFNGASIVNHAQQLAGFYTDNIRARAAKFYSPAADEAEEGQRPLFATAANWDLPDQVIERIRLNLHFISGSALTAGPLDADEKTTGMLPASLNSRLFGELLHFCHKLCGEMQESLLGELCMSGFALSYLEKIANGAQPVGALPVGRRHELTPGEAKALHAELVKLVDGASVLTNRNTITGDLRASIRAKAQRSAGRTAFKHVSATFILNWCEACPGLAAAAVIPTGDGEAAKVIAAHGARLAEEGIKLRSFIFFITIKNHGIAGIIYRRFMSNNGRIIARHDGSDVASLLREELARSVTSFDHTTGTRFSTYAYSRLGFEVRRKPHQERQLISLGHDQTTAQPRVYHIAKELGLEENDPSLGEKVAAAYNERYAQKRGALTANEVIHLLSVGRITSISGPASGDDDKPAFEIPSPTPGLSGGDFDEVNGVVLDTLKSFSPPEELTLAVLTRASKPHDALRRFTNDSLRTAVAGVRRIVHLRTKSASRSPFEHGQGVQLSTGHLGEVSIRSKPGDESARNARRNEAED